MDSWYCMNLGDAMLAAPELERVARQVALARQRADNGDDMAAFVRHESEGRLHCEVMVYVSPAAAAVAHSLGARPCARPARGDLSVLEGAADAGDRLLGSE